jgi:uncharacterized membrane protein
VSRHASRHAPRGRRREQPPPPPSSDWIVAGVAAAGLVVAGYLTVTKFMGGGAAFCAAGGGCDAVQASHYATLLGVPTALWGALAYAAVGALAVWGFTAVRWQAAFAIAAGAVGFSAYLTWISASVIHAFCPYCLTSGTIAIVLLAALIWRRTLVSARRPFGRPARLIAIGAASAIAAIVVGAGIYAANPESADPAYREALARHLTASGMTMYGSFT